METVSRSFILLSATLALTIVIGPAIARAQDREVSSPRSDENEIQRLLTARGNAEELISNGELSGAFDVLLKSLREVPPEEPRLADVAYGSTQLLHFLAVSLMPDELAINIIFNRLDPEKYEVDEFLQIGYQLIMSPSSEEVSRLTRKLMMLADSKNEVVGIFCVFCLSNPYLYNDDQFRSQYTRLMAYRYPNLELTQFSLNLPLLRVIKGGDIAEIAKLIEEDAFSETRHASWSASMRKNFKESASLLQKSDSKSLELAFVPIYSSLVSASDWRERYFSILLMKNEFSGQSADWMRDVAREIAAKPESTPDVIYARNFLVASLSGDCVRDRENKALLEESVATAQALLSTKITELSANRVMWYVRVSGIRACADNLAAAGHSGDAVELYKSLAAQYPLSKLETECKEAIAGILRGTERD